jgi:hypothetical protein
MITPSFSITAAERVLPRLSLDFLTASLDPRITFTRSGNTATRIDSSGNVEVVDADLPRFDYSPATLAIRGLLIEETRTNPVRNNTMVGAFVGAPGSFPANWNATLTANGVTQEITGLGVENGIDYIDVRYYGTPTAGNNVAVAFETINGIAASSGQTWTQSVYLKLVNGSFANISLSSNVLGTNGVSGTESFGAVISSTPNPLISSRFTVSGALTNAGTTNIQPRIRAGYTVGLAFDITLRIGLPQIEQGAFATSVIKTSTAAVTRNADIATMTGANFSDWYSSGAGGVVARVLPSTVSGTRPALQFDDATANEVITLRGNTTNPELVIVDGGAPQAQIDAGTIVANTAYNLGAAWNTDNCAAAVNGGAAVTDTTATIPAVTQARLGSDGTNYLNGHLQTVRYWPQRIINTEVQAFSK